MFSAWWWQNTGKVIQNSCNTRISQGMFEGKTIESFVSGKKKPMRNGSIFTHAVSFERKTPGTFWNLFCGPILFRQVCCELTSISLLTLLVSQIFSQRMPVVTRVRYRRFPVTARGPWMNIRAGASRPHPLRPQRTEMAVVMMMTTITTMTTNVMVVGGVTAATVTFISESQSNCSPPVAVSFRGLAPSAGNSAPVFSVSSSGSKYLTTHLTIKKQYNDSCTLICSTPVQDLFNLMEFLNLKPK